MADSEIEERARSIAEFLQKRLDYPAESRDFWQRRAYFSSPPRVGPTLREIELQRAFAVFARTLSVLRSWGRQTIPGVDFSVEPLPSNPEFAGLTIGTDPISVGLRAAWQAHREGEGELYFTKPIVAMPIPRAAEIFSHGLAVALASVPPPSPPAAGSAVATAVVHFTIHSQHSNYRIHVTERYWYSPVVFGAALSTPVDDWVYPADYRVGGEKSGVPIIWDQGIHTASAVRTATTVTQF